MHLYILDFKIKEVDLGQMTLTEPISLRIQQEDSVSESKDKALRISVTELKNETAFQMFLSAGGDILGAAVVTYQDLQTDPVYVHFEPL